MRSHVLRVVVAARSSLTFLILSFTLTLLLPMTVSAAALTLNPASGNFPVGTTFTAAVNVESGGTPINAVSGVVTFPSDILEVVSLSKASSVITLWVQEPVFSNGAGTIQFEGVVPSPGYSGASGRVLGVVFRVKAKGQSALTFSAGSVLANDGEGTEVLTNKTGATYSLVASPLPSSATPTEEPTTPSAPKNTALPEVVSVTHPEGLWSHLTTGTFDFTLPSSATALRLLVDDKPTTVPVVTYVPPLSTRQIKDLSSGVSYLHVQYKTAAGWGAVLHYKLQIDTVSPEQLVIREVGPGQFTFAATDTLSGLDTYTTALDGGEPETFVDNGDHIYRMPTLSPGAHTLVVTARDKAGNTTDGITTFTVVATAAVSTTTAAAPIATESLLINRGTLVIAILSVVVPLVALVLLLGWLLYLAWRTLGGIRRKIDGELKIARAHVHQTFITMRMAFEVDAEMLRKVSVKRKLTREESKILKHLEQQITQAETAVTQEINDIEASAK